jgi:hypothetical protein
MICEIQLNNAMKKWIGRYIMQLINIPLESTPNLNNKKGLESFA